jgi:hypothetical protein
MVAILPYPNQLPSDYAKSLVPSSGPTPSPTPSPTPGVWAPVPGSTATSPPPPPAYQMGGVWVGTVPPTGASYGWLWLNSSNNGLYVFGDPAPGTWTQIGTNW